MRVRLNRPIPKKWKGKKNEGRKLSQADKRQSKRGNAKVNAGEN